ncbi:LysR family transcriptional regulator [Ensifer sp. IC3342]|nr:LysR family transcriptional regulator [Ensifer sp. BRP08]MCA1447759.1 LysR family transcriptional regulator [Ensifer sp. IC3342]
METHQIRYFLAACQTLNFSRAAELCEVSVPSLTKSIHKLEQQLGGHLFRRERHLTHLTDLGRLMHQHFTEVQNALDAAKADAERYENLHKARLKLGVFSTMPGRHLTSYLRALRAAAPDLRLNIWETNCEELGSALLAGDIDVAFMSATEYGERLRAIPLFQEPYFIAFAAGHRFEGMNAVPLRDISGEAYIKRLHCEFPSNLSKLGVAPPYKDVQVRYMSEREDWIQLLVLAGLGCTVMPQFLPIIDGLLIRRLVEPEVSRQISIVTVAGRPHSKPVSIAVKIAQSLPWNIEGAQTPLTTSA